MVYGRGDQNTPGGGDNGLRFHDSDDARGPFQLLSSDSECSGVVANELRSLTGVRPMKMLKCMRETLAITRDVLLTLVTAGFAWHMWIYWNFWF